MSKVLPAQLHDGSAVSRGWFDCQAVTFAEDAAVGACELTIVPGLVDLHIHGGFGIDVMSATPAQFAELDERLGSIGIEYWLPTTVTSPAQAVDRFLSVLPRSPSIPGFHLEGPFLSPKFPGAQPPGSILDPSDRGPEWDRVLFDGRLRVITLAPERPGALDLIRDLAHRGVIVSMGHTDASFDEASEGFRVGMAHSTHTFNAMRGLHHRDAGALGAAMTLPGLTCELIYDRVHVSRPAAEILMRTRLPGGEVIGVSDSTMATGLPEGTRLYMWNLECIVGERSVNLVSNGALAGSKVTLVNVFQNLMEDFGIDCAIRACSLAPRRALGLSDPPKTYLQIDPGAARVTQVFRQKL